MSPRQQPEEGQPSTRNFSYPWFPRQEIDIEKQSHNLTQPGEAIELHETGQENCEDNESDCTKGKGADIGTVTGSVSKKPTAKEKESNTVFTNMPISISKQTKGE